MNKAETIIIFYIFAKINFKNIYHGKESLL